MMMATGTKAITPSPKSLHRSDVLPAPAEAGRPKRRAYGDCGVVVPWGARGRRYHDGERVVLDATGGRLGLVEAPRADEGVLGPLPRPRHQLPHVQGIQPEGAERRFLQDVHVAERAERAERAPRAPAPQPPR